MSLIKGPTPVQFVLFYATIASPGTYGSLIRDSVGEMVMKGSWAFLIIAHSLESIYMLSLCVRHKTGVFNSVS